jgi:hypothetical protein
MRAAARQAALRFQPARRQRRHQGADASPGGRNIPLNKGVASTPVDDKPEECQNRVVPRLWSAAILKTFPE